MLLGAAVASACAGGGGAPATPAAPPGLSVAQAARLDAAVAEVDRTRSQLLAVPAAVVTAATALDAADDASASGSASAAAEGRRTARPALPAARTALAATGQRAADHRTALRELAAAAQPLPEGPATAVAEVVAAGEQETAATERFAAAALQVLPAYAAVDEVQATWLDRARAGWYRDQAEAAAAYAVAVRPRRAALDDARTALRAADEARRPATERQRAALTAADRALEALRAPAG